MIPPMSSAECDSELTKRSMITWAINLTVLVQNLLSKFKTRRSSGFTVSPPTSSFPLEPILHRYPPPPPLLSLPRRSLKLRVVILIRKIWSPCPSHHQLIVEILNLSHFGVSLLMIFERLNKLILLLFFFPDCFIFSSMV